MSGCAMGNLVERHFAGTISPQAERVMRGHLPTCDACQGVYRRHFLWSRVDPAAVSAEERIARGLGLGRRGGHTATFGALGFAGAAAAAVVLLLLRSGPRADRFAARGTMPASTELSSRVFVYEVGPDGRSTPAGDSVHGGDELAFAYENAAGKHRLAIFGIDEDDRVYWFFPAWTDEASDPVAVPIEADAGRYELPEAIRHRFEGRRLEIRSLFLDEPISVRRIEGLLRQNREGPLPIPGAVERSLWLTVTP